MGVHLHLHPKFYTVLAVAVGGFLALFTGLFFYSLSPSFCRSGHLMSPITKPGKLLNTIRWTV
jgi:amino acid transporter